MKTLLPLIKLLVCALMLVLVSACSASPTPTPVALAIPATATAIATNTPNPPTATPTAMPTDTDTPTVVSIDTAAPTATPTAVPPTATLTTVPPTATKVLPTATRKPVVPTVASKSFTVAWKTGIQYDARDNTSFWCKLHNEYQNLTTAEMPFQNKDTFNKVPIGPISSGVIDGYQPVFGIANPDGTINRWAMAGWYSIYFGWPNGISDFPPKPIAANANSGDWTWYSRSSTGEYCRYIYIRWKGQTSVAEFAPNGTIVTASAQLPPGAP